jgi:uridine kinase
MYLVGIAGGSGSGKTTFAKKIIQRIPGPVSSDVVILHQDSYYLPTPPEMQQVHGSPNFDHPDSFDWPLLTEHLKRLKQGLAIEVPVYDFKANRRTTEVIPVGPCKTILMEGIFALWDAQIRNLFNLKIYLHVEADIRFIRRLHRDVRERGRSLDGIIRQYYDTVRPMHHEFLEPTQQYADFVVGEETDVAAEVVAARVAAAVVARPSREST